MTTRTSYPASRSRSRSPGAALVRVGGDDGAVTAMCRPPLGFNVPPLSRSGVRWREDGCKEPPSVVSEKFERTWHAMEHEVDKMHNYMDNFVHTMDHLFGESINRNCGIGALPLKPCLLPPAPAPAPAPIADATVATPEAVQICESNGERRLVYSLDLDGFKPDEIKVNLCTDDGIVTVDACHEERDKAHYFKRHYSRKFAVPEDLRHCVTQQSFRSFLNERGTLSIEAPLPRVCCTERTYCCN